MHKNVSHYTHQVPFWKAEYHEQFLPSYQGNPLIETIPPIPNRDQVYQLLQYSPVYDEKYRQWPDHLRMHLFLEAARFFQPLNMHFDLQEHISRMLHASYVGRNPLDLGFWSETERRLRIIGQNTVFGSVSHVTTQGITLFGISGTGKSRTLEQISALYPQVIQHTKYHGKRFTWTQLVWLKLECPFDGSITGLCHDFFQQVDLLLGTNYYEIHGLRGRPTVDTMRIAMARVASDHSLGFLIIDEIQNLRHTKSAGADKMLSFLVQLDNTIGVPIIFVGTPKARAILKGEFRRARRAAGQGDVPWERMVLGKGSEWPLFLETLWKYQYVHKQSDLTDELRDVMYDESQGITDIAIKLYFLAQIRAIVRREECITSDTIRKTAKERLHSVQDFLYALRSNNRVLLHKYEDIQPVDFEGAVWEALRNVRATTIEQTTTPALEVSPDEARQNEGTDEAVQEEKIMQQNPEIDDSEQRNKDRSTLCTATIEGGLLETVAAGRELGMTAYEALKQGGFIRDTQEYLAEDTTV